MNFKDNQKGAAVKFPPPLVYLIWMLAGFVAHHFHPLYLGNFGSYHYIGLGLVILGIALLVHAHGVFKKAETNITPWEPTTTIITSGMYSYTRNPIYLAFNFVPIGLGIFFNNLWVLFSFIPATIILYFIAIKKEECYLEEKFGKEYLEYKKNVRRWL